MKFIYNCLLITFVLFNVLTYACIAGKYDEENLEMNTNIHTLAKKIADSSDVRINIFPGDLSIALAKNFNELNNFLGNSFFNIEANEIPNINWFVKHVYTDAAVDNLESFEHFKIVLGGGLINKAIYFKTKEFPSAVLKFYRNALNFYADPEECKAKKALLFLLSKAMN